jgi:hypothetical protein
VLLPVRLDHLARDAALAQLGLDHATAAWAVAVPLLAPPAGKRGIVEVAELREALGGGLDDRLLGSGAAQPPLELPARPRTRAEEVDGNLERLLAVGRDLGLAGRRAPTPLR